jgi:indolepyruvate ferredoxin oxidoreductase, alpha subunit
MKQLLLGNEAVAKGAWEAGCRVVAAYPGTPSTEITEAIAKYKEIYAEWSPNEKVAAEVGVGASTGGARTLVCMKHVGLNVAADPVLTASYIGVNGGLVIAVADDPGMHSSQNEQDSRFYARMAQIPMLEPADSQECLDFTKLAFDLSEQYDTPIFLRLTTRVAHSRSLVETGDRADVPLKEYKKDMMKRVMMPGMARRRHVVVEERMKKLAEECNAFSVNTIRRGNGKTAVVTAGISSQYVMEALPEADVFKVGMVYPLPVEAIRKFSAGFEKLYVVEDLEPFIEDALKAAGIPCIGKELTGVQGEPTARMITEKIGGMLINTGEEASLPTRPPVMCPGCPHRGVYHVFNKMGLTVFGDIGCYTLGALAPLNGLDTCLCMGASIGMAHGFEKAMGEGRQPKAVAVIGDSTFIHSGITPLINAVYNQSNVTVCILDNSTTGMTGHQHHPATGKTLQGADAAVLNLEGLCRAVGVRDVRVVDAFDIKAVEANLKESVAVDGPSVIIFRRPCVLLPGQKKNQMVFIDTAKCRKCKSCMRLGCPAIENVDGVIHINSTLCAGCGLCQQTCAFGAIVRGGQAE